MSDPQVTLYSDADYKGTSSSFGRWPIRHRLWFKNDSLELDADSSTLKVTLCEDANFGGRRTVLCATRPI